MMAYPSFSVSIPSKLVVRLAEAALSGDDAAVRAAIIDIAGDIQHIPEWCDFFLGLAGEKAARRVLWVRWRSMAPARERREMERLFKHGFGR